MAPSSRDWLKTYPTDSYLKLSSTPTPPAGRPVTEMNEIVNRELAHATVDEAKYAQSHNSPRGLVRHVCGPLATDLPTFGELNEHFENLHENHYTRTTKPLYDAKERRWNMELCKAAPLLGPAPPEEEGAAHGATEAGEEHCTTGAEEESRVDGIPELASSPLTSVPASPVGHCAQQPTHTTPLGRNTSLPTSSPHYPSDDYECSSDGPVRYGAARDGDDPFDMNYECSEPLEAPSDPIPADITISQNSEPEPSTENCMAGFMNTVATIIKHRTYGPPRPPPHLLASTSDLSYKDTFQQPGRTWNGTFSTRKLPVPEGQVGDYLRKPDLILLEHGLMNLDDVNWSNTKAVAELTKSTWQANTTILQTLNTKAYLLFSAQPWRRYVLGLTFAKDEVRLHLYDRSGSVISKPYNFHDQYGVTLCLIHLFAYGDRALLGFDPTIQIIPPPATRTLRGLDSPIGWVCGWEAKKKFDIIAMLWATNGFVGRGTVCYLVRRKKTHSDTTPIPPSSHEDTDPQHSPIVPSATTSRQPPIVQHSESIALDAQSSPVSNAVEVEIDDDGDLILKDYWAAEHLVDHETKILEEIRGLDGVPDLVKSWTVKYDGNDDTTMVNRTLLGASNARNALVGRYHRRILMRPVGYPITSFRSQIEFLSAFRDIVLVHEQLVKRGILHCDISPTNMMLRQDPRIKTGITVMKDSQEFTFSKDGEKVTVLKGSEKLTDKDEDIKKLVDELIAFCVRLGLLIDFDYAARITADGIFGPRGTGTLPFVSIMVLRALMALKKKPKEGAWAAVDFKMIKYEVADDVEALLYVFIWICCLFDGPGAKQIDGEAFDNTVVSEWSEGAMGKNGLNVAHNSKFTFLAGEDKPLHGQFVPFFSNLTDVADKWRRLQYKEVQRRIALSLKGSTTAEDDGGDISESEPCLTHTHIVAFLDEAIQIAQVSPPTSLSQLRGFQTVLQDRLDTLPPENPPRADHSNLGAILPPVQEQDEELLTEHCDSCVEMSGPREPYQEHTPPTTTNGSRKRYSVHELDRPAKRQHQRALSCSAISPPFLGL